MELQRSRRTDRRLTACLILAALLAVASACGGGASSPATAFPPSAAPATASSAAVSGSPAVSVASPSASSPTNPLVRGWSIDQASGGGRITGRHCGGDLAVWKLDGTYDRQGQKGVQHWEITIDLVSLTDPGLTFGTFTYTDKAQMTTGPVTVTVDGKATGNVTLRQDSGGRALMHFEETAHSFRATVPGGGERADQNAPLAVFDVAWEVDPSCP